MNADRRGSVLIGECTSDNGVHVHRNAIFMCAPALPYVAGCLAVAARPPELRRRSGAFGRRRERPPCFDASCGIAERWHVHTPCHSPPGGRSPPAIPRGKAKAPLRAWRVSALASHFQILKKVGDSERCRPSRVRQLLANGRMVICDFGGVEETACQRNELESGIQPPRCIHGVCVKQSIVCHGQRYSQALADTRS